MTTVVPVFGREARSETPADSTQAEVAIAAHPVEAEEDPIRELDSIRTIEPRERAIATDTIAIDWESDRDAVAWNFRERGRAGASSTYSGRVVSGFL